MCTHSSSKFSLLSMYKGLPKEIYILFLCKMINCIGAFVHPLLTLILTQKIGISIRDAGVFLGVTALFQAPALLLGGKLVDSIGRKEVIILCQGTSALLFIICAFITPSTLLAKLLIAASSFASMAHPAYDSMVGDLTNRDNRKASFSLIYMGLNLGFSIGPLIGGFLFKNHLSLLFIGDALTTLFSIFLIIVFIKNSAITSFKTPKKLENSQRESIFKVLLNCPILLFYALLYLTFSFAYAQWNFAVPIQLEKLFSIQGARYFGLLASFNGLLVILLTPLMTNLTKNFKTLHVIAFGGFLYALSFTYCAFSTSLLSFFIVILLLTLGEVLIAINSAAFINNLAPVSHRGRVNAIIPLITGTGAAIGPLIMGAAIDQIGIQKAWSIAIIVPLIGAMLMYRLPAND